MSGKRKKRTARPAKTGAVWRQSADEATLAQNPRYNGFACGYGAHGERKFNRAKANRAWKAQLRQEGASRGLLPFLRGLPLKRLRYLLIARFVHRLRKRLQKCQRTFALRPFADKRSKPKS